MHSVNTPTLKAKNCFRTLGHSSGGSETLLWKTSGSQPFGVQGCAIEIVPNATHICVDVSYRRRERHVGIGSNGTQGLGVYRTHLRQIHRL